MGKNYCGELYSHTHIYIYTLYIYISVNIGPGPIFFIFIFWDIMEQPPNSPWRFSSLGKSWNNWRFSSHVWWHQRVWFPNGSLFTENSWGTSFWERLFPECVARVPVSLWGSGGWGCVRSTLRNRSQLLATVSNRSQLPATVCNRPQPPANVRTRSLVPMASSAAGVTFGGFTCPVQTYLFFLRGRRNIFATFSEDEFQSSWQVQHFGDLHRHFAWQAQHFRGVALRVFCESHCQGCLKWWQSASTVAGVAFCEMRWKLMEASHETSILR